VSDQRNGKAGGDQQDLPDELRAAIDSARIALEAHPLGELPLPYRRAIWKAMGPSTRVPSGLPDGLGYRRSVALDAITVQHVLPFWKRAYPDDDRPEQMLRLADAVVRRQVDWKVADQTKGSFATDLDDLESDDYVPRYVGDAAVRVVSTAIADGYSDAIGPDTLDEDLDPFQWDSSYIASLAAADFGAEVPGEDERTQERRREFWRWYLDTAVPAAYRAVS
jgi:hypothetical protein